MMAYILLNSKPDSEDEILNNVEEIMKGDTATKYEIREVYGVYNMVLKIESISMNDMQNILEKIRKIDKITSTITMIVNEENES